MMLYRDAHGKLQHMPYRKAQSHQERIPWISHHPIDVKRGTFVGEMSRLATLCSVHSHYIDAVKGLVALYCKRGYPADLVHKWVKDNFTKRWESRLREHDAEASSSAGTDGVFVLKSTYNTAWDWFSAKELGDIVIGYWKQWLAAAESNRYSIRYPKFSGDTGGLGNTFPADLLVRVEVPGGNVSMPDIRKIPGFLNRRMIVSRKRTRNLFDLTGLWKKTVITALEHDVSEGEQANSSDEDIELHRRSPGLADDEDAYPYML